MRLFRTVMPSCVTSPRTSVFRNASRLGKSVLAGVLSVWGGATVLGQNVVLVPTISTYAGNGNQASTGNGGQATAAAFNNPEGIAYDLRGNTYIADYGGNTIRIVSPAGIVSPLAGTGATCTALTTTANACGDNGPASAATFNTPTQMQFDAVGNLYIADYGDNRVRKIAAVNGVISPTSIVTTVAGTGTAGSAGNGAAATAATLNQPHGLAIDRAGNLYIAEQTGCVIRRIAAPITTTSVITLFAGTAGTCGYVAAGDGASATGPNARFAAPTNITTDAAGNVYVGDYNNGRVRKITIGATAATTILSTVAGTGRSACPVTAPTAAAPNPIPACGDGGPAASATLNGPTGVTIDTAGNIIIGDAFGARVREILASSGNITTIGGTSQQCNNIDQTVKNAAYPGCGDGGSATKALISFPILITVSPTGVIQFVDQYDNKIRQISNLLTFPDTNVGATSAVQNVVVQLNAAATINSITVPVDAKGTPEFTVGTITGCTLGAASAIGTQCTIPVTFNPAYTGIQAQPLVVVTSGGNYSFQLSGVGIGPQAALLPGILGTPASSGTATANIPAAINTPASAREDVSGNIFIADTANSVIRVIYKGGVGVASLIALENNGTAPTAGGVYTLAGTGVACAAPTATSACGDGSLATAATLNAPTDIFFDLNGNLLIADSLDNRVRSISASTGIISTIIGTGANASTGDGVQPAAAAIGRPVQVVVDQDGGIYVLAQRDNAVRFVPSGVGGLGLIQTIAGTNGTACTPSTGACGDNAAATAATLNAPSGIAVDSARNVYIADTGDNRIRLVSSATNNITTIAGTGTAGFSGDGAAATAATLNGPTGVFVDAAGNVWIADKNNAVIREVLGSTKTIISAAGIGTTPCVIVTTANCGDGGPGNVAAFLAPSSVIVDTTGTLLIADSGASRIRTVSTASSALAFATTPIGNTSAPQAASLQNIGNAALALYAPGTAGNLNPSLSAGYTYGATSTCPQLTSTAANGTLAAGARCTYSINFAPTAIGILSGQLIESDSSLNAPQATPATQTIALSGAGTADNPTVTLTNAPNPSTYGQPVTLSATVAGNGTAPAVNSVVNFYTVGATQVVNLQATPTSTTTSQVLNLPAGTYAISVLGNTGGGLYTAWNPAQNPTTNNRWTDRFGVQIGTAATTVITDNQGPNGGEPQFATDTAALAGYQSAPEYVSGPLGGAGTTPVGNPYIFTLTSAQAVTLSVPDPGSYGDDTGGLSLAVAAYTQIATGTVNAAGVATGTTANLPVGTTPTIAIYQGDANHVTAVSNIVNQVVTVAPLSNDTLTAAPATSTAGTPVTLTFTVPVAAGNTPPAAGTTVTFTYPGPNGAVTINAPATFVANPNGTASYVATTTTSSLPIGTYNITGTLSSGDPNYAGGALTTQVTVNQISGTADKVTPAATAITVGAADKLTFSVPVIAGAPVPAGTVAFTSGGTNLGTATFPATPVTGTCPGGAGTCYLLSPTPDPTNIPLTVAPAAGTTITATFTATAASGYASAAPTTSVTVTPAGGTGDTLTVATNPTTYGIPDQLTFNIPVAAGAPVPTGTVVFTAGGVNLGTATWPANPTAVNGFYSLSVTPSNIPVGAPTVVTATYTAGAGSGYGSAAPTANVTVNKSPLSNDSMAVSPTSSLSGQSVNLIFSVPNVNNTPPAANSTVNFTAIINGVVTTLGTANVTGTTANGVTTYTTSTNILPVGSDTVTGTFTGDANYAGGPLTAVEAVGANNTTDTVTVVTNPTTVGAADTITFTIPAVAGAAAPTGSVAFTSGGVNLGTATWPANPVITNGNYTLSISTTALPLTVAPSTSTPVQAVYTAGAASGYTGTTATTSVVVNQAPNNGDAVTVVTNPTTVGAADTITFTIPVAAGVPAPAGTVVFTSGTTNLGTATWPAAPTAANGVYSLSISTTLLPLTVAPATSTPVTATFTAAAASGYGSAAPTTTVVVNPASGAGDSLIVTNNPTTFGTPDPLTFRIPVSSGAPPPSGTVTFSSGTGAGAVALGTATWPANPVPTNGFYTVSVSPSNIPVGAPTTVNATFAPTAGSGYGAGTASATVAVNQVPISNDGIAATPSASKSGTAVVITFTVPNVAGTAPAAGSTVQFTYTPQGSATQVNIGTAVAGTTANGVTTYTVTTSTLPIGTNTIYGNFSGDTNYAAGSLNTPEVVSSNTTTDTVTVTTNPTTVGSPDVITFTIPVVNGSAVPTGQVVFTSGGVTLGTANWPAAPVVTNGNYNLAITTSLLPLTVSPSTSTPVLATYTAGAASGYASATASTTVVVNQVASTGDVLTPANGTITVGSADGLTFSVPVVTGAPVPAGTVNFTSGSTNLGSATWPAAPVTGACPSGGGTCYLLAANPAPTNIPLTVAPATSTPVTATFTATPASGYASGTASAAVIVNQVGGTGGTLTIQNNPTTYGTPDPLTFSLPATAGVPPPSGTVVFTAGGVTLGTANWPANPVAVNGVYSLTISPTTIPIGNPTTVTATFTPTAGSGYGASAPTATVVVNKVPSTGDTLTANPTTITFGNNDTLTFTVNVPAGVTQTPGGTVTFSAGSYNSGPITVTNGVATVSTTNLPVGAPTTVTGVYTGDATFSGATLTAPVTVNAAGGDSITVPNPVVVGQPTAIVFTVPVVNGVQPTGSVSCTSGTTILAPPVTVTGGTTTITTTLLPVSPAGGTTPVSCAFTPAAGSPYGAATPTGSTVVTQVPSAGDTLVANPTTITFGGNDTLTFTVNVPAGETLAPGGTVTFSAGSYNSGPITVTNGKAIVSTTNLPVGAPTTVTGVYTGDINFAGATLTTPVTVNASSGDTISLPTPVIVGQPTPITFTIPVINGVPPAGSVSCSSGTTVLAPPVTVTGGTTVVTTTLLPVSPAGGTTPVSCNFTPTAGSPYAPATPTTTTTVNQVPSNGDTLTANPTTITFGNNDTLTFTVNVPAGETLTPGGTVTFTAGTYTSGPITVTNGKATVSTTNLPVGAPTTVTGVYTGDTNFAGVTLTTPVTVNAATGDTIVIPAPVVVGQPTPITFTIPVVNGVPPTGTVSCTSGTTVLAPPVTVTGGTTVVTTTLLPVSPAGGTTPVSCTFTPAAGSPYGPATPTGTTVVNQVPSAGDTLTANPTTITFGNNDTLTFTVNVPAGETLAPGGTVTFTAGTYTSGPITVTNGKATVSTTNLPVGAPTTVTGVYTGDANFAGVTLTTPVTVNAANGDTITIAPTPSAPGDPVRITLTIPVINGVPPAGTVSCTSGTTVLAPPVTVTGGTTVVTTTLLPVSPAGGTTPVSCTFTPTAGSPYAPATPTATTTVVPTTPTSIITVNPMNPSCGASVTLTNTITLVNGQPTYGTVQFYNTINGVTTPLGAPVAISPGGVATLTTTALPCSADSITAVFTPASNPATPNQPPPYTTVTGGPLAIPLSDFTISATPPLITVNPGDTAVYTVALSGAGGVAFPLPVTLTATGLPAGATVTFGNGRYIPGVGPTPTTMTIVTSPLHSQLLPRNGASNIYYGLLLLPLLGVRRIRRKLKALPRGVLYGLAALLMISGAGAMTGCSGGYFGPNPNTYTITVTGTSGTLVHSTSVTLTIR